MDVAVLNDDVLALHADAPSIGILDLETLEYVVIGRQIDATMIGLIGSQGAVGIHDGALAHGSARIAGLDLGLG